MRLRGGLLTLLLLLTACQQRASSQQVAQWTTVPPPVCTSGTTYGSTAYLAWGAVPAGTDHDGYLVERQKDTGPWQPLPIVAAGTTRLADGPLSDPGEYHWQVRTQVTVAGKPILSPAAEEGLPAPCLTIPVPPPEPSPLKLSAQPTCGATCVSLLWTGGEAQGTYTLERWTQDMTQGVVTSQVKGTSANDATVRRGTYYCYHIAVQGSTAWSNDDCLTISP
jgi:hypothetical protein